jgi:hypothetical protein
MSNTTLTASDSNASPATLSCGQDAGNSNAKVPKTIPVDPVSGVDARVREDGSIHVSAEGKRATYRAAVANGTLIAAPTEMFVIQGSASKKVAITRIAVTGGATAAGSMQLTLTRRSDAGTLGSATLSALTKVKLDTTDASAGATVSQVATANYGTPGTAVGYLGARRLNLTAIGSAGTSGECKPEVWEFGHVRGSKPIVLVDNTEWVTVDGEGSTLPSGAVIDAEFEWVEYT